MLKPRWRKVLGDLWSNKTRTLLVVLSIAVGVFAVGMVGGARVMLRQRVSPRPLTYTDRVTRVPVG